MSLIESLVPRSEIDRLSFSFEQLFPGHSYSEHPLEQLDSLILRGIAASSSDLHVEYRERGEVARVRHRNCGDGSGSFSITTEQVRDLMTEMYRLYANAKGISMKDCRIGWYSSSFDFQLSDGTKARIYPTLGLSYPHGFDLLCRILIKSDDNHKLTEINDERDHGASCLEGKAAALD